MWIEIVVYSNHEFERRSRPARALWIEIIDEQKERLVQYVEAREGLVD